MGQEVNKTAAVDLNLYKKAVAEADLQVVNEAVTETESQIAAETVSETGIVAITDANSDMNNNNNTDTEIETDKTPWGLIVLAVINLIIVLNKVVSIAFSYYDLRQGQLNILQGEKLLLQSFIVTASVVMTLTIASTGLLLNKAWGWWISASYYFFGILSAALGYYSVVNPPPELAYSFTQSTKTYLLVRYVFNFSFSLLIFLYIFRKKKRRLFSIKKGPIKIIFIFLGISLAISIASAITYKIILKVNF